MRSDRDYGFRLGIVLGITAVYALIFLPLHNNVGASAGIFASVPVVAAAVLLGLRGGLVAGLGAFVLNSLLLVFVAGSAWTDWVAGGGAIGHVAALSVGAVIGWAQDSRKTMVRAEVSRRRSEQNYHALIENMDATISLKTVDGRYVVVNQRFADQVGIPVEQIIGRTARGVYGSKDVVDEAESHDREILESATPVLRESGRIAHDNEVFETRKAPVLDSEGSVTGIVTISTDVTQIRAAEAELRGVHDQYRLLVDNLEEAVSMKEASGRFVLVNKAFSDMIGLPKEEIEGRFRQDFYPDTALAEAARKQDEEILRTGNGADVEFTADFGFGPRTLRGRHTPVPDAEGRIYRIVSSAWDITERKGLENRVLHSQKMEAIGRLAGGVAHDFNNLLTAIMGYAELGRRDQPAESRASHVFQEISQVAERAATLIRQLLTFSRAQSDNPVPVDLNELVVGLDSMLRRLIGEDIEFITLTAPGSLTIRVDPGQMEQVLTNLVVNARDAMPRGGKLTVETADTGSGHARLTVTDTGVGMTDDVMQHIFEPFYTTKGVGEGSGLGLSTSYGIVTQSGGTIDVSSEIGQGTRFDVILPMEERDAVGSSPSTLGARVGGNEKILLVEDEPQILSMASQALRDLGYDVLEASNGIDALSIVEAHPDDRIDLILTDLVMPMLGGRETADRVSQAFPGVKVIFTSGFHDDALEDLGGSGSHCEFLAKPFSLELLGSKVREVLDQ